MAAVWQSVEEFCRDLLCHGDLAHKLASPRRPAAPGSEHRRAERGPLLPFALEEGTSFAPPPTPAREASLAPSRTEAGTAKSGRLPGLGELADPAARIACLQRFAHHELQAIELFAWAILRFPQLPLPLRRGFLLVLEEEQQHLQLYLDRLAAHGASLAGGGSDYLWRHTAGIEAAAEPVLAFLSAVGLTFEQANLDFAGLYRDAFRAAGDVGSAEVLERVHRDEIRHVRLAIRWLARLKQPGESELSAYLRSVPFPLSPARAKGRRFDLLARRQAGLPDDFIAHVAAAQPYRQARQSSTAAASATESDEAATESRPDAEKSVLESVRLWLLPNLGGEEDERPLPKGARGFLRGLHGAWASLFPAGQAPFLLPPGDAEALAAWQAALPSDPAQAALPELSTLWPAGPDAPLIAWLNTAAAAAEAQALRRALLGPLPSTVLAVHHKGFAQAQAERLGLVPACLQGLCRELTVAQCRDPAAAEQALVQALGSWPGWLASLAAGDGASPGEGRAGEWRLPFVLKPAFGTSGRGRVHGQWLRSASRVDGAEPLVGPAGRLLAPIAASAWAELARRGGAIVEPWLSRVADYSVQLAVGRPGADPAVTILATTTQILSPSGQIRGNRGALTVAGRIVHGVAGGDGDAASRIEDALTTAAQRLGAAAAAQGFYGIAGIDAFCFVGPDGQPVLRPVVELNARFTTGTVAAGLLRRAEQAGRIAAQRRQPLYWALLLKAPRQPLPTSVSWLCPLPRGPALLWAATAADLDTVCLAAP